MKLKIFNVETVDCTADPHIVSVESVDILSDIALKTCESSLVKGITQVKLYVTYTDEVQDEKTGQMVEKTECYKSDYYSLSDWGKNKPKAEGPYAKKHKVEGMFFAEDYKGDRKFKLPIGLSGVKKVVKKLNEMKSNNGSMFQDNIKKLTLSIGVVWTAFDDHNCSDYITVEFMNGTIDLSNQDWYVGESHYDDHISNLNKFLETNWGIKNAVCEGSE